MGLGDFYGCYMGNSNHFIIAPSQWVWLLCNPVRACVRNRRVFVVPAEAGMTGNLVGPARDASDSRKIVTHALRAWVERLLDSHCDPPQADAGADDEAISLSG